MNDAPSVLGAAVGLLLFAPLFALVQRWGGGTRAPVFALSRWRDWLWWFFSAWVTAWFVRLAMLLPLIALVVALGLPHDLGLALASLHAHSPLRHLPVAAQLLLGLALADGLGYWRHRLMHKSVLWRVHAIHHAPEQLDWLSASRQHPLDELQNRVFGTIPLLLLGLDPRVFVALGPVLLLYGLLLHVDVPWSFGPLRYVLVSPRYHRWHHSREPEAIDKNFAGLFPAWDLLFGTFYLPRDRAPTQLGVDAPAVPQGLLAQLAFPFRAPRAAP